MKISRIFPAKKLKVAFQGENSNFCVFGSKHCVVFKKKAQKSFWENWTMELAGYVLFVTTLFLVSQRFNWTNQLGSTCFIVFSNSGKDQIILTMFHVVLIFCYKFSIFWYRNYWLTACYCVMKYQNFFCSTWNLLSKKRDVNL